MEIFSLDVGQASCNIVLLGSKQAIVIDAGSGKGVIAASVLEALWDR